VSSIHAPPNCPSCTKWHNLLRAAHTVCGISGLLLHDPSNDAASEICEGLSLLQHRGQDACGIVTCGSKGRFYQCKANGMVRDVFDSNAVSRLIGGMGIGHGGFGLVFFLFRSGSMGYRGQCAILLLGARIMLKLSRSMSIHHMVLCLPM